MAVAITFKDGKTKLVIDAATAQHHIRNAEITKHSVETGADISDHIRIMPNGLSVTGVISTVPIIDEGDTPDTDRHIAAFNLLDQAIADRGLLTVSTGLKIYKNMGIKHITYPREVGTGIDLIFTIEFDEVLFAKSKTVQVPKSAIGPKSGGTGGSASASNKKISNQGTPKASKGVKAPVDPNSAQGAAGKGVKALTSPKSILKTLIQFGKTGVVP